MILVFRFLVPKGYNGITIFPFVFLKNKTIANNKVTINHEKIHLKQQLELLIFPFYILYLIEYGIRFFQYKNPYLAYRNISFEREAYDNQNDFHYLKKRKFWNFLNYLKRK